MSERIDAKLWAWVKNIGVLVGWVVSIVVIVTTLRADINQIDKDINQINKDNVKRDVLVDKLAETVQSLQLIIQKNQQQDQDIRRAFELLDKGRDERLAAQAAFSARLNEIAVIVAEMKVLLKDHTTQPARVP